MFRQMRRINQQLPEPVVSAILKQGAYGVLSVQGDDGYPYGVPLNYVISGQINGKTDGCLSLYFHCAKSGHKLDGLKRSEKVSFCIVNDDEVLPEEFTTAYASVIVFGRAVVVDQEEERLWALRLISERFSPGYKEAGEEAIKKYQNAVEIVRLDVESVTGKAGQEWLKRKGTIE